MAVPASGTRKAKALSQDPPYAGSRALVAPDKFKGTFSALEVAEMVVEGFQAEGWTTTLLPVADGGEGTADALLRARGGRWIDADAHDALGRPIRARVAMLDDGVTAVVEVAAASGLWRLAEDELDAAAASTRGTGELIAAAVGHGASTVIVAAGGSATTDGGSGAIEALGELPDDIRLIVACDVTTPWEDAASVFGPQKGAGRSDVEALARRLDRLAGELRRDPRGRPMTGCAGGLAGGLWAHFDATLVPGAELVLEAIDFDAALPGADLVVTGEGKIDDQTLAGKAVGAVAQRCSAAGVPCYAVVGRDELSLDARVRLGLGGVLEAGTPDALRGAAGRLLAT